MKEKEGERERKNGTVKRRNVRRRSERLIIISKKIFDIRAF